MSHGAGHHDGHHDGQTTGPKSGIRPIRRAGGRRSHRGSERGSGSRLGRLGAIAVALSGSLGAVFVLPGIAVESFGWWAWVAFAAAGLLTLPAVLSKAELASAMPVSGGAFVYLDRAFGPAVSTVAGVGLWVALLLKSAFAFWGLGHYVGLIVGDAVHPQAIAFLALGLIAGLNLRGMHAVGRAQFMLMTGALLALVALASAAVVASFDPGLSGPATDNLWTSSAVSTAAVTSVFLAYAGVTKVAAVANDVEEPERNVPIGMLSALVIAIVAFSVVSALVATWLSPSAVQGNLSPVAAVAERVIGREGMLVMSGVAITALFALANAGLMAASRFPFAMARDHLLPSFLGHTNDAGTPTKSVLMTACGLAVFLLIFDAKDTAALAGAFILLVFVFLHLAVLTLRESQPQWFRPAFRAPFYPWLQVLGIAACLVPLSLKATQSVTGLLLLVAVGTAIYRFYGRQACVREGLLRQRQYAPDEASTINTRPSFHELPTTLIPLFGHERSPERILELGAAMFRGRFDIVRVIEIPEIETSEQLVRSDAWFQGVRNDLETFAEQQGLVVSSRVLCTRNVGRSLVELSSRLHCQAVIFGSVNRSGVLGAVRAYLRRRPPRQECSIVSLHDAQDPPARVSQAAASERIHSPQSGAVRHIAYLTRAQTVAPSKLREVQSFAWRLDAEVEVLVVPTSRSTSRKTLHRVVRELDDTTHAELLPTRSLRALTEEVLAQKDVDLVICDADEWPMSHIPWASPISRLRRHCSCPVMMMHHWTPPATPPETLRSTPVPKDVGRITFGLQLSTCRTKRDFLMWIANTFDIAPAEIEAGEEILGEGLAILRVFSEQAVTSRQVIASTRWPMDFGASDGNGVDLLFVEVCHPDQRSIPSEFLDQMVSVAGQDQHVQALREASSSSEARHVLRDLPLSTGGDRRTA